MGNCKRTTQRHLLNQYFTVDLYSKEINQWVYAIQPKQKQAMFREGREKAMAPHSSVLAWRIPGMGEPGVLQSMRSQKVGHNLVTEK